MSTQPDDKHTITQTVTRFFHALQAGDWTTVRALLTDTVRIAHGPDETVLSNGDLASGWRGSHAKFDATQYDLGAIGIELTSADRATARFDSRATFVPAEAANASLVVIAGCYTVGLERSSDSWRIRSIGHDESR
jgi:ketosteroid isomerase-like protein